MAKKLIIKRKVDSPKKKKYNGVKLGKEEYARLASAVGTYKPMEKGPISQILDNKKGEPAQIYDVFVDDDGRLTVLGKHAGQNIHKKEDTEDAYRKRKKSYLRNR